MARVKRGVAAHQYKKKVLKRVKGFYGRSKNCNKLAKQAMARAGQYNYRDRRVRRRDFRALWIVRINAAVREMGLKYSQFMNLLKKADITINRKMLAELACNERETFNKIVKQVQK